MAMPDYDDEASHELRCAGTLHGVIKIHHGIRCVESKCHHIRCTKGRAVNVFHYHSLQTGELVDTVTYQDPGRKFHG
jgi:hypothetical protein